MYEQEKITPYHEGEKASQVEQMFDNIAPTYDKLNHRLSWDIDKGWRKKAIKALAPYQPQSLLDIATGTGDFAILAAQMLRPQKLVGADISEGMMEIGRQKVKALALDNVVTFEKEDCLNLSYQSDTFDAITAAFGIRNFADLDAGLREMYRVLKPGGHLSIIELTTPVTFPMKQLFHIYSHTVLPIYGRMISRDTSAYSYLTKTLGDLNVRTNSSSMLGQVLTVVRAAIQNILSYVEVISGMNRAISSMQMRASAIAAS